ncbi:MAG: hypothetical protein NWE77_06485 [Candidatus Bathyarchaeota archaeon]|jgi:hypothetical protein|nr:hypothetical protein [Candidatus Bathyarchaeota archaeon]
MTAARKSAAPKHAEKTQQHKTFPSPLELYKHKSCRVCTDSEWCKPNELRMLICVLCAILDTTLRNNQLAKQRGAHY